jgi:CRP/FNR family transcriptional regulator
MASVPVLRHVCALCSLREWCWPSGLDECDLIRLHTIVQHSSSLPAGSHVFRAGDPFTAIYAVRRGCIKSYTTDLQGHEHVRDFHLPGELLGFDAVYPERHHFNAMVLNMASVCIIPYRDIAELSRDFPGLQTRILALMSRDFSRQQMCVKGSDAKQQIAIFLFDIESRVRRQYNAHYEFELPMSHEDIANYLRFSPETVSRVISKLQQAGLINVDRRHVRLLDVARLGQIAQGARLERK